MLNLPEVATNTALRLFLNSSFITHHSSFFMKVNPHLKPLEQVLAARYGWQGGATWREQLLDAIECKAAKLGLDHLVYSRMAINSQGEQQALADIMCTSETR